MEDEDLGEVYVSKDKAGAGNDRDRDGNKRKHGGTNSSSSEQQQQQHKNKHAKNKHDSNPNSNSNSKQEKGKDHHHHNSHHESHASEHKKHNGRFEKKRDWKHDSNNSKKNRPHGESANFEEIQPQHVSKFKSSHGTGLPIYPLRDSLLDTIRANNVVVVVGATGSGKTTQLPQFILDSGMCGRHGKVACTQPRRVAAVSVAERVGVERQCSVGGEVGYSIRFDDRTSTETRLVYMTDGMLLRETLVDPLLSRYNAVLLDEAHERTVQTDVLFALIKGILEKRKEHFRVVIMSATMDADRFAEYFHAPIFNIPGRQYPVEIMYTSAPEADYVEAAWRSALQVHGEQSSGDILLFLTGQEEIETVQRILSDQLRENPHKYGPLLICPLYANLPQELQMQVFQPPPEGSRKIILSTNIAETSVTIPGIRYVIDTGLVKARGFKASSAVDSLLVVPVSKAQANQRAGRAGREAPGVCYRLYTEKSYKELDENTVPEIRRSNVASVVLQLKALGIENILDFDFLDPPPKTALIHGVELLMALGALDKNGDLTECGKRMSELPLEPCFAKLLYESKAFECTRECLTVAAMLSVDTVFYNPTKKREEAKKARMKFASADGDHAMLINVYDAYVETKESEREQFCRDHFLQSRTMKKVCDIRKQLFDYLKGMDVQDISCGADLTDFWKCLCRAFATQVAQLCRDGVYRTVGTNEIVAMHPSSSLFGKKPPLILFNEIVFTNKLYIRTCSMIDPAFLAGLGLYDS